MIRHKKDRAQTMLRNLDFILEVKLRFQVKDRNHPTAVATWRPAQRGKE